jgi:thioredoxin:protein disulfide reductase
MKAITRAVLLIVALFAGIQAGASDRVVSIKIVPPGAPLKPGQSAILYLDLAVAGPYHINSDRPLEDYLIPTTLNLRSSSDIRFGKVTFPPAAIRKLPVSENPMAVFEGNLRLSVEILPGPGLKGKEIPVTGQLRYQACDDRSCLPPVAEALNFQLPVAAQGAPGQVNLPETSSLNFEDRGVLATILLVFFGGLALNLTPCVYPMIPITITYFGGQSQGKKGSLFAHSLLYVIGMAVTYSFLGVAAAMTGGLFGAALRYPPVLVGIAGVMVLLSLSMFDVYELRMPGFLNRLAGGSQKGFGGTLLMGLTLGIIAAPCIGPFVLGLLTYVGNRGNAILGFLLFFVLALGLGMPFLALGIFSGSIRRLPRSGAWMVWVRKIFGFVLLAMAVHFLEPLFPTRLASLMTMSLLMLLAGIYMAWIDPTTTGGKAFPYVRNAVGILFFSIALYAAVTGLQEHVAGAVSTVPGGPQKTTSSILWQPYSEEALAEGLRQSKPILIDFYADWCAPCRELDNRTFTDAEVVALSARFLMLKVDLTSADNPRSEDLRKKYGAKGVPTLVFLRPNGREIPDLRVTGFEPKDIFLGKMKAALQKTVDSAPPI